MNAYRRNEIYISNEVRFYLGLRAKQLIGDSDASITHDEVANNDLRCKYTTENPEWVIAWDKRETLRQQHKKELLKLEAEAVGLK